MKKTFLLPLATGCMLMLGTIAMAQVPAAQSAPATKQVAKREKLTDDQKIEKEVAKLDAIVHLTPDQQTKVKQLFASLLTQREKNKAEANGDKDKLKELNQGIGKQRKEGLKAILTPEQQAALKEANKEKREERMGNSQPAPNK